MQEQFDECGCPVCMNLFTLPITIPCGHTFCRSCLIQSTLQTKKCPMCRTDVAISAKKMREDLCLAAILKQYKQKVRLQKPTIAKTNPTIQRKQQTLPLLKIRTPDLLLPTTRTLSTFELPFQTMLDRLDKFVALQQQPYINQTAVISKIINVIRIKSNVYQGLVQGLAFCRIGNVYVQSQLSLENQQEYLFQVCAVKEICEASQMRAEQFKDFANVFKKINREVKNQVYKKIKPNVFESDADSLTLFYSAISIINLPNEQKYKIATNFNDKQRINFINNHLQKNKRILNKKPQQLISIIHPTPYYSIFFIVLILFIIIGMFSGQGQV